ncbi:MAG: ATP-binding protein [Candidatus Daviesbacteria bacterium]|nr:ATP-binding protein [Candidatus Daviesbacteria bacterium]
MVGPEEGPRGGSRRVLREFIVTEEASLRMGESAMSNYRDANLALMDLVDNAVDNRIAGEPLRVYIRTNLKDQIIIRNEGGAGLDLEGFQGFLRWGISSKGKDDIGQYGVGGKAAMGFLGKSIEVSASAKGSDVEYFLSDPHWGEKQEVSKVDHIAQERPAEKPEGYFSVKITNLNLDINDRKTTINTDTVAARLGNTYKPLLDSGAVKIYVNGHEVTAPEIKYLESDPNFKSESKNLETGFGNFINITVGVLAEGQKVKPGIRCYYRGRLIEEGEFFDMPTSAKVRQASRLFGEAHLDDLAVTMNKSDFNKTDARWIDAATVIRQQVLEGWYKKLEQLSIENTFKLESWEKDIARDAKRVLDHILSLDPNGDFTKKTLPGGSSGRLPATPNNTPASPATGRTRNVQSIEGATAPNIRATKAPSVPRWGAFHEWEPVSMGNPNIRSEVVTEDGKEIVKINIDFALYQAAKKAGKPALLLYQGATAISEICARRYSHLTPREFKENEDKLLKLLGDFCLESNLYVGGTSRGTIDFQER